ncbi:MAG: hypothetical protein RLZZ529_280 [Bacteroidota bacterium]|jgi:hypothetical protein
MKQTIILILTLGLFSCNQKTDKETAQGDWIKGTETEQIKTIEKQFRGFDNAMVETGYRYQELYWAGQDQNWEYADYQIQKIQKEILTNQNIQITRKVSIDTFYTFKTHSNLKQTLHSNLYTFHSPAPTFQQLWLKLKYHQQVQLN